MPSYAVTKRLFPLIAGEPGAKSPQEAYFFYSQDSLQAVRMGRWKLHFPHAYATLTGQPEGRGGLPVFYVDGQISLALFDLENDMGETINVADQHPEIMAKIRTLADRMRAELGDSLTKRKGAGVRQPGRLQEGDLRFQWMPGQPVQVEAK